MRKTNNQEPYGLNPIWFLFILITIIALCLTACAGKGPEPVNYAKRYFDLEVSYDRLREYYEDTANLKKMLAVKRGDAIVRDTIIFPKHCVLHKFESTSNQLIIQYLDTTKFN